MPMRPNAVPEWLLEVGKNAWMNAPDDHLDEIKHILVAADAAIREKIATEIESDVCKPTSNCGSDCLSCAKYRWATRVANRVRRGDA